MKNEFVVQLKLSLSLMELWIALNVLDLVGLCCGFGELMLLLVDSFLKGYVKEECNIRPSMFKLLFESSYQNIYTHKRYYSLGVSSL